MMFELFCLNNFFLVANRRFEENEKGYLFEIQKSYKSITKLDLSSVTGEKDG